MTCPSGARQGGCRGGQRHRGYSEAGKVRNQEKDPQSSSGKVGGGVLWEGVRWLSSKQKTRRVLRWPKVAEQGIYELLYGAWDNWLGGKTWAPTSRKTGTKRRCERRLISISVCILKSCFLKSLCSTQACRCNTSLELQEILHLPGITVGTHTYVALPKTPRLPFPMFQKVPQDYHGSAARVLF